MTVFIPRDRRRLAGKLLAPGALGPSPGLLFVHGWGSSQRRDIGTAKQLVQLGYACLTFNLTGHARTRKSIERVTRADNLRDVLAALDFLAGQPQVDALHLGIVAISYGGYLATLATTERKIKWLALRAPAIYKDADFDRPKRQLNLDPELPTYRRTPLRPGDNRVLGCAASFEGDVLIVESEHDTVIPHQVIANYLGAFAKAPDVRHHVIRDADHALAEPRWRRGYASVLRTWFAARLAPLQG